MATRIGMIVAATAMATVAACGSSGGSVTATVTKTVAQATDESASQSNAPASSSVAAATAPDACSLLTRAEAQQVAGTTLLAPEGTRNGGGAAAVQCLFTGPTTGPTAQVEIYVGDGAKQQLTIERDNLGHTFSTVPGIGDECVQEENFIFVRKGALWASLRLVRLNDAKQNVMPLQTGMKQITARLP